MVLLTQLELLTHFYCMVESSKNKRLEVCCNHIDIHLSQKKYTLNLLQETIRMDCVLMPTPMTQSSLTYKFFSSFFTLFSFSIAHIVLTSNHIFLSMSIIILNFRIILSIIYVLNEVDLVVKVRRKDVSSTSPLNFKF